MAVRKVNAAVANASPETRNLIWQMAGIINQLATTVNALVVKLDTEATLSEDYVAEIGEVDTLETIEKGTPD